MFLFHWRTIFFLGNEDVFRALIELGAKINAEDKNKQTPLHLAASQGLPLSKSDPILIAISPINFSANEDVVRALIELGAKVDAEDVNKKTPSQIADQKGDLTNS